eukprot:CAMPEP_0181312048 /NCGR_PEP_ID=MMETSP1101-20121128/13479_1 /TAXON_ID=46948 /ORGANISM="Rhodomonas abbreviata, Strain Caron Lab Isolate" /LENGTH=131 /DNA_ID=CAMNT_0023418853 /DNA_START=77 /DNA_END=469 /DNA_ORIENTATION=+
MRFVIEGEGGEGGPERRRERLLESGRAIGTALLAVALVVATVTTARGWSEEKRDEALFDLLDEKSVLSGGKGDGRGGGGGGGEVTISSPHTSKPVSMGSSPPSAGEKAAVAGASMSEPSTAPAPAPAPAPA